MSEETWLIVDSMNLLYRAFHTTGELYNGSAWGFLRQIRNFEQRLGTARTIFAFDLGFPLRKKIYPEYKSTRHKIGETRDCDERREFLEQVKKLRTEWLYEIGYQNVFAQEGYEADDIIASVCKYSLHERRAFIVSSDKDLYQLLSEDISIWKPHKKELYTKEDFQKEWRQLNPSDWYKVKSMAGCSSDNIKGIKGIGEITATKYLTGEKIRLGLTDKMLGYDSSENDKLTKLPYPDVNKFVVYEDETTVAKWKTFAEKMNMQSLLEI